MRTATLTFHGSHNYGSMLQAYALQQAMIKVFGSNKIINFRSPRQKRMMRVISMRPALGPILKDITHLFYYLALKEKHRLFECFLSKNLILSSTELTEVKYKDLQGYDLICCGSDQIWNPGPEDFDLTYLLPYKLTAKKISYAVSMGPGREIWPKPIEKYPELLKDFDKISVREVGTKSVIENLTGRKDIMLNCDPVLLLEKEDWLKLIDKRPIIEGKYIFMYTLFAKSLIVDCAKAVSKKYGLPIIISNYTSIHDLLAPFRKNLKSGPREFLNLLFNATMVITSSFHGTVFSILLNKPFSVVNGLNDNRISNLLKITGLENRSISSVEDIRSLSWEYDLASSDEAITQERMRGIEYLKSCRNHG